MSKNEPIKSAASKTKINEIGGTIGGWRRSLFSPFRWATMKKAKWKTTNNTKSRGGESRISSYLNTEAPPTPEDITLTTGTVKKRKKSFEIFHWKFILWSVLFVLGLLGTTMLWFTAIYHEIIFKSLTLGNGSKLHVAWKNPPLAPLLCVHIFNYTNVEEYFSSFNSDGKHVKLKVQDVGPYCFRETIERKYVTFRKNDTEMSYREQRLHTFDPEYSVGSLDDTVFVPNVLILSVYKELREKSSFTRFFAYAALSTSGAKVLIETTAQKYIFGYEDGIFSTIGSLHEVFSSDAKTLPKEFGALKKRSGLSNDTVVVKTGIGNLDMMGQVVEVNNMTKFSAWSTDQCNLVTGSDGLFFRRSAIQTRQDVQLFHKDSCRGLPMLFDKVEELKGGIPAYRYKLRPDVFDTNKPENQCYCNVSKTCNVRGVMDISYCASVQGAPMVISRPHFMDSNVNLDENGEEIIEGFQPDIEKHDFHVDIFPPIGLTVRTLMRMQLNVRVHNPTHDRNLNPLKDRMVLPMVWVEMNSGTEVPEKMYALLYHLTYTMRWGEIALKWTFLIFTLFMAFVLYRMSFVKSSKNEFIVMWKKKKSSPSIVSNVYVIN